MSRSTTSAPRSAFSPCKGPSRPMCWRMRPARTGLPSSFPGLGRTEIGGATVDVSRQGFTGEVGYELWVSPEGACPMWDALMESGRDYGLRPAGEYAIDIARVEAGLLIIGADYMGAGPDPTPPVDDPTQMRECSPFRAPAGALRRLREAGLRRQASPHGGAGCRWHPSTHGRAHHRLAGNAGVSTRTGRTSADVPQGS